MTATRLYLDVIVGKASIGRIKFVTAGPNLTMDMQFWNACGCV